LPVRDPFEPLPQVHDAPTRMGDVMCQTPVNALRGPGLTQVQSQLPVARSFDVQARERNMVLKTTSIFHCSLLQLSPDFEGFRGLQTDAKNHISLCNSHLEP
jgi:hypothetical protein